METLIARDEWDQLAAYYSMRLNKASEMLERGDWQSARDVCLELRLKADISVFSRARLNLLLAKIYKTGSFATTHAYECIDLLDILRQRAGIEDFGPLQQMIDESKDVIDSDALAQQEKTAIASAGKVNQSKQGPNVLEKDMQDLQLEPKPRTISSKKRSKKQYEQMEKDRAKYEVIVEGFLRVGREPSDYTPCPRYKPLSRNTDNNAPNPPSTFAANTVRSDVAEKSKSSSNYDNQDLSSEIDIPEIMITKDPQLPLSPAASSVLGREGEMDTSFEQDIE